MNKGRLITTCAALLALAALAGPPACAGLLAQETPLAPDGWAYELNVDSAGVLWISDLSAGEIRSLAATGGGYVAYPVGGAPSDARSDGAGSVWWADYHSNRLGRLSTATNQATLWEIPGSDSLYSTAIDGSGDVWVSDYSASSIYKLDPDTNRLCTYALPNHGMSEYLLVDGGTLWFGDIVNARIVRLQGGAFAWWNLPGGSYPRDLALDESGRVWWTDAEKGYLGRLDSGAATITTFTPPAGGTPAMLALFGDEVWYSQQDPSRVVELDPAAAVGQTAPVSTGSQAVTPECRTLPPLAPVAVTPTSGQASWTGQIYSTALATPGWTIYRMPPNSAPWGIAATDVVWLVDAGRKVLGKLDPSAAASYQIYLPLARKG